ncbi:MAG: tRNA (adenosine(37)-N6)-threonylcarbamoyltransferase complex transferase subunit TsaD [Merismopedia sp. SIO2A8]|nr:tRNA (adenosine(37)-N6)-threonylcarbamoyltransferase complex transferase subunit TsaD [Merismopedia sp. SIO2A8]
MTKILAIETSCDETAVAVVSAGVTNAGVTSSERDRRGFTVLSNVVSSQIETHRRYGGIVPEVASRQHVEVVNSALEQAIAHANCTWDDIDAIAATSAPGLVGALLVGLTVAKTLAMVHQKPFLGIHHLEGHIYASYLSHPELKPPFLSLLVSGGHTSLINVQGCGQYQTLGATRDDAAGEAFDKVGRLLDLGYPGGPVIDRLAKEGDATAFLLPEGNISLPGGGFHPYDCSFSGLKTAMLRLTENLKQNQPELPVSDLAASFQYTVAKALTKRAIACALDHNLTQIAVGGGVAANSGLRSHLTQVAEEKGIHVLFPPLKYCTDNAAMIGCAAIDHFNHGHRSTLTVAAQSRMSLEKVMTLYDRPDQENK